MALNISKTEIPNTDPEIPPTGSGMASRAFWDPVTPDKDYEVDDTYNPASGSWCGCRFAVSGTQVNGGPARPYGVIQVAALELYLRPFVMNTLARFPMDEAAMEHAIVQLSAGTITKKSESITFDAAGVVTENPITTETSDVEGSIGVAGLFDVSGSVVPRLIGSVTNTGTLDTDGAVDIIDQVKTMRHWSRGNCMGFTWFLLPGTITVATAAEATEGALDSLLGSSNIAVNGSGYYEGTASVSWLEWSNGYGFSSGGLQLSEHTTLGTLIPPRPPRFDV